MTEHGCGAGRDVVRGCVDTLKQLALIWKGETSVTGAYWTGRAHDTEDSES